MTPLLFSLVFLIHTLVVSLKLQLSLRRYTFLYKSSNSLYRLYIILDFLRYLLSDNIFIDNYRVTYLVNNKELLEEGLFIKSSNRDYIELRTSRLNISRYNKYIIRKIFNRTRGLKTEDLILYNIIVIKGFYINIVLYTLLQKVGIQYYSFDYTLRFKDKKESIVIIYLLLKYNLTFLEYKPFSIYISI